MKMHITIDKVVKNEFENYYKSLKNNETLSINNKYEKGFLLMS